MKNFDNANTSVTTTSLLQLMDFGEKKYAEGLIEGKNRGFTRGVWTTIGFYALYKCYKIWKELKKED